MTRVQIPAYTDAWMRGDRYGNVVKVTRGPIRGKVSRPVRDALLISANSHVRPLEVAHVLLDKSNEVVRVLLADCEVVS